MVQYNTLVGRHAKVRTDIVKLKKYEEEKAIKDEERRKEAERFKIYYENRKKLIK